MKVIHKDQAETKINNKNCIVTEYNLDDKDINGAIVELTGRYPQEGRVVNLKCKEIGYILDGFGRIVIEDNEIDLKKGDMVLIEPGEKYFWEGNLTMFVPCTPAWYPEQNREIE